MTELVKPAAGTPGTPMIRSEALHKRFGKVEVLKGIDLEVARGEVMCLLGPSGSGKSTFLRCINHLEQYQAGRLWVDGELVGYRQVGDKLHQLRHREVAKSRRDIGMVFQRFNLFPHKTAIENVMEAPVHVKGVSEQQAKADAEALLDRVGLLEMCKRYPSQLSGGQQQRVAIARSLINDPQIILADEATGNLDSATSEEIMTMLGRLNDAGKTIIMVTHEDDIAAHAKRIIRMRDGVIVEDGPSPRMLAMADHGVAAAS
jgi:polar amino acid transport system ATP-binding protein